VINKIVESAAVAVADIHDGATIMIGGFGTAGMPSELIEALIAQGARDLIIVNNNAGNRDFGVAALLATKRVRKIICSFPRQIDSYVFDALYRAGEIELELVPQGNLAERIRRRGGGVSARSSRRPGTARCSPKARKRARSMAAIMCSNTRSTPTLHSSRPCAPIAGATLSTARRPATSVRSWRPPPGARSRR
jgi:3-oxoadipate CoA-transferase alpha subunit